MKKLISFFLLAVLFGCVTGKPEYLTKTTKDSTGAPVVVQIPFDTLLYLNTHQGQAINFNNCDSLMAELLRNNNKIETSQNGVKQTITKKGTALTFKCQTDSFKEVIRLLRNQITVPVYKTVTIEVPANCKRDHLTKWDNFFIVLGEIFSILLLIFILSIGMPYVGKIFRPPKP